jgi:hypothetical protein
MSKLIDLTGQEFGRLTVIKQAVSKNGRIAWNCKCDCGKEKDIIAKDLRSGKTQSCGCFMRESVSHRTKTHGQSKSRLYFIWTTMKQRCENPNSHKAKDYFERGITICPEWHSFDVFQEWALANGYSDKLTIDRMDNNKGYGPENCHWTNNKDQANNRRSNVNLTFNGITQTIAQWAESLCMEYNTLHARLSYYGWSVEKALTTPVGMGV